MNRKLEWNSAGIADPCLHALCQDKVMSIARYEVASSLCNTDDRPSRLEFLARQTVVEKTLDIESGHIRVVRVVPPRLAAQLRPVTWGHCVFLRLSDASKENELREGWSKKLAGFEAIERPVLFFSSPSSFSSTDTSFPARFSAVSSGWCDALMCCLSRCAVQPFTVERWRCPVVATERSVGCRVAVSDDQ